MKSIKPSASLTQHKDPRLSDFLNDRYFRGNQIFNYTIVHSTDTLFIMVKGDRVITATRINALNKNLAFSNMWVIIDSRGAEVINKAFITDSGIHKSAPRYA